MDERRFAKSFKDLIVYQRARAVAFKIFTLTKTFPKDETYSLTDQIRRSSRSIGAQIAEAWGKRSYEKHFVAKLTDADSEQQETQHWIEVAVECGYLNNEEAAEILNNLSEIGKMLHSMIEKANSFCSTTADRVRDTESEYFTGTTN